MWLLNLVTIFSANFGKSRIVPYPQKYCHLKNELLYTLRAKDKFDEFGEVMQEYFDLGHAELVPPRELPTNALLCTSSPARLRRFTLFFMHP